MKDVFFLYFRVEFYGGCGLVIVGVWDLSGFGKLVLFCG